MFENLVFMFMCFIYLIVIGGVIMAIDFTIYYFYDKSPLVWLEKIIFEKFGHD